MICPNCRHILWYVGNPDGFRKVTPERRAYHCAACQRDYLDSGDGRLVLRG